MRDVFIRRFKQQAQQFADKPAYTFIEDADHNISISFAELDQAAEQRAAQLQGLTAIGTPIVLCLPPGMEFKISLLACLYAGMVVISIPPPDPKSIGHVALEDIFADTQARYILTRADLKPTLRAAVAETAYQAYCHILSQADLPAGGTWQAPSVDENSPAFCSYTSGTTGRPKGVIITQGNLLTSMEDITADLEIDADYVLCTLFNHYHIITALWELTLNANGAQAIYLPIQQAIEHPILLLKILSDEQVNLMMGVNLTLELCVNRVQHDELKGINLSRLQLLVGGDKVKLELLDAFIQRYAAYGFRRTAVQSRFGQAEGFGFTSSLLGEYPRIESISAAQLAKGEIAPAQDEVDRIDLVTSGTALPSVTLRIVDLDTFTALGEKQVGEVWIKGGAVGKGYWNQPDKTAEAFGFYLKIPGKKAPAEGPFLRTGDMGYLNEYGEVFLVGRLKERLYFNGQEVYYPDPIEKIVRLNSMEQHIHVSALAAFSTFIQQHAASLCIAMEIKEMPAPSQLDVFKHSLQNTLSSQYGLDLKALLIFPPNVLPRTKTGKIKRNQCHVLIKEEHLL